MILIYTLVLVLLGVIGWLIGRRVARLERKYTQAASAADGVLREATTRPGNSGKHDSALAAQRQYLLGQLVNQREQIEQRYVAWQQRGERFGRLVAGVREWKGKKLPYTFGILDVSGVLWLLDHFGVGQYVSARPVIEIVTALWNS